MNRRVFALVLAAAAAVATGAPAVAATGTAIKPQVHDAAGDWKVPSQDVLDATFAATKARIVADVHLSAPPALGVRTDYDAAVVVGCHLWSLHFTWLGGAPGSSAALQEYGCPTGNAVTDAIGPGVIATYPATATVTATGFRIVAAPTKDLHRGVTAYGLVETRLEPVLVVIGTNWDDPSIGGDLASGTKPFILGG